MYTSWTAAVASSCCVTLQCTWSCILVLPGTKSKRYVEWVNECCELCMELVSYWSKCAVELVSNWSKLVSARDWSKRCMELVGDRSKWVVELDCDWTKFAMELVSDRGHCNME